ncbi:hypothetical protein JQ604_40085 [Bradyrhizobium jicamae]|uniref:hypothetical protein n=1 Tax=Bradyrhizobium jicamae TaxID=280332 RepID=UPI001BA4764D|nr:hypothetical protein [Bradyrhizobium jicamae]MBR0758416.1 hypothetical protein [Bradyrhizobium jicamae]
MRKRSKPHTFEQRLDEFRRHLEEELARAAQGEQRDAVLARIDQLRTAAEMHAMLSRQA